jgi:hypothetical protein
MGEIAMIFRRGVMFASLLFFGFSLWGAQAAANPAQKAAARKSLPEWQPLPFPESGTLPKNYKGLDAKRVWHLFKSKEASLKKGEYETTLDYQKRLETADLLPLVRESSYAFSLKDVTTSYDADAQQYSFSDYLFCKKTYDTGDDAGWFTCKIDTVDSEHSTYIGTNSFGASAVIDKSTGKDFAIAVRPDSPFFKSVLFQGDPYNSYKSSYELKTTLPLPIEHAKALQGLTIGVLLVGKFAASTLIEGRPTLISPTLNDPIDIFVMEDAAPFDPQEVVFYVVETGEILARTSIN